MSLSIGIVGLPNVGKSTLFNALTKAQNAASANYPFCTIEPNKAVVPVPDARLDALTRLADPQKVTPATVDFIDIAGLVKGASKGEGLGNQFLGNIRQASAILHVVRCFEEGDVVHVDGSVDPVRDIEVIETELILADLQSVEKARDRLAKGVKGDRKLAPVLAAAEAMIAHLEAGGMAVDVSGRDGEAMRALLSEVPLITDKKVIYCANVDEKNAENGGPLAGKVRDYAAGRGAQTIVVSARMEEELAGLSDEEAREYLQSYGLEEGGLDKVIRSGYVTLGLISFFTVGPKEVRAWTVRQGWKAPQAAGVIHTDFERGFIRAEIAAYDDYIACGSEAACKAKGLMRVEGKEYVVADGDVIHFLFNV